MMITNENLITAKFIPKTPIPGLDFQSLFGPLPPFIGDNITSCFATPVTTPILNAPITKAVRIQTENGPLLQVDMLITSFTVWNLNVDDFLTLYDVLTTDHNRLVIQMQTDVQDSIPTPLNRTAFLFRRTFTQAEISQTSNPQQISDITQVEVIVHNINPKTSRGTTTTVQSGTGG